VSTDPLNIQNTSWPTLAQFPVSAKGLISCIILTMAIAMLAALGQIVIHDIIPTFFDESETTDHSAMSMEAGADSGLIPYSFNFNCNVRIRLTTWSDRVNAGFQATICSACTPSER